MTGESIDTPKVADLVHPVPAPVVVMTEAGPMSIDMELFAEAAEKLGADKYDVMSIGAYQNAKGELVPDYDSVHIERRGGAE